MVHAHTTPWMAFCVWRPSHSVLFKAHLCCWMCLYFTPFALWLHIIPCCDIPWQGHAAVCLYIRLFMDVWAVFHCVGQKVVFHMILWKNLNKFLGQPIAFWSVLEHSATLRVLVWALVFKMVLYLAVAAGPNSNSMFNFAGICWTVVQRHEPF